MAIYKIGLAPTLRLLRDNGSDSAQSHHAPNAKNLTERAIHGTVKKFANQIESAHRMDQVYHARLGDSRRLALPAALCRELDLKPGEELLLVPEGNGLKVTSLRNQGEMMRRELKGMFGKGKLTDSLKKLRKAEAARETDPR